MANQKYNNKQTSNEIENKIVKYIIDRMFVYDEDLYYFTQILLRDICLKHSPEPESSSLRTIGMGNASICLLLRQSGIKKHIIVFALKLVDRIKEIYSTDNEEYMIFLGALIISYKFLEDVAPTNKTYLKYFKNLDVNKINNTERMVLLKLCYDINVCEKEWKEWLVFVDECMVRNLYIY